MDKKKYKKGQIIMLHRWNNHVLKQDLIPGKLLSSPESGRLPDSVTIGEYGPLNSIMYKDICLCEIRRIDEPLFHISTLNNKHCIMVHKSRIIRHATDEEKKDFYKSKTKSK